MFLGVSLSVVWMILIVVLLCVTLAPLFLWRNTNRMNRLLALQILQAGVDSELVVAAWKGSGGEIQSVPGIKPVTIDARHPTPEKNPS